MLKKDPIKLSTLQCMPNIGIKQKIQQNSALQEDSKTSG